MIVTDQPAYDAIRDLKLFFRKPGLSFYRFTLKITFPLRVGIQL